MTPEERKAKKRAYNKAYREANREALTEKRRAYYEANRVSILEGQRAYYETNKEARAEYFKSYHEANKEAVLEKKRAYYEANKEARAEYLKSYRKANPEIFAGYAARRRAAKHDGIPDFLRDCPCEKRRIVDIYKMCRLFTEITGVEHHVDHMWPLSKGGPHWSGNLQIIPAQNNLSKSASVCKETKKTIREALKWAKENYCDTTNDQGREATLEGT